MTRLDDVVAWDLLTESPTLDGYCKYWNSRSDPARYADRMERRQAEFLVQSRVELRCISRIGVMTPDKALEVQDLLQAAQAVVPVAVMPAWYF